jgi:hypothetical protein
MTQGASAPYSPVRLTYINNNSAVKSNNVRQIAAQESSPGMHAGMPAVRRSNDLPVGLDGGGYRRTKSSRLNQEKAS